SRSTIQACRHQASRDQPSGTVQARRDQANRDQASGTVQARRDQASRDQAAESHGADGQDGSRRAGGVAVVTPKATGFRNLAVKESPITETDLWNATKASP